MPKNYLIRAFYWAWIRRDLGMVLLLGLFLVVGNLSAFSQEKSPAGTIIMPSIGLDPVGRVERRDGKIFVEVQPAFAEALDGIRAFPISG